MLFRKAFDFTTRRVGGLTRLEQAPLAYLRARILAALIVTGLFLGFLGFIPLTVLVLKEGLWRLALLDVAFWLAGIALLVASGIRYEVRAAIALALVYLLGLHVVVNVGPLSGGTFLIFSFSVLAGVLLGARPAILALGINAVTFIIIGGMMIKGAFDHQLFFNGSPEQIILAGTTILLANAMATISLSVLVTGLVETSRKERALARALEIDRTQLQTAKEELEKEIDERRSVETALRESEKKYRDLFNNLPIGIGITDMTGRLLDFNEAILKPGGYNRSDAAAMESIDELYFTPDDQGRVLEAIGKDGALDDFPARLKKKDGTFYHARLSLRPITIKGQTCWHAMVRDVTEKKQLEEQLQQAQKMEAVGTLAGGIAHRFNNLLMGIQGRTSLVMAGMPPHSRDYRNLALVEAHVGTAAELVRQLLGLARRGKYDVKTLSIDRLIRNTLDRYGQKYPNVLVHRQHSGDLGTLVADEKQIEQALLNLCTHAGGSLSGGGEIFIEADNQMLEGDRADTYHLPAGRYVIISIADTNTGMEAELREKLFDPFFTTRKLGHDAGLGLASAYGIVLNHGGTIMVDGGEDEGITFSVLLPVSDMAPAEKPAQREAPPQEEKTVLLVDDEEMIIDVGGQMLKALGYKTITAVGGAEAVRIFAEKAERIDMVILDMVMHGMDGRATFKALKAVDPDVNVVLSSGYSIDGQTTEILDMGCRGFIQKPFSMQELAEKLKTVR